MTRITRRQALVAGGAAALALAGCGGNEEKPKKKAGGGALSANRVGAMSNYGVGDQFKATEPVEFSIMVLDNPGYPYDKSWAFWKELESRTNVTFDPTVVPGSDYNQKRGVMISGGNAPMIIPKTYAPDEEQFVAGGAILPVSDYIDLMPHFKDKLEKWSLQADIDTRRQADGKFYLLPGVHEDVWTDYSLAMRTDVLDDLGLEVPETWDDVHTVLTAMKDAHPDLYPFSDRWSTPPSPGANSLLNILGQAYGTGAGWGYQHAYWDVDAGKFVYTGAMDQYRQMLEYLFTLVDEKLLDPESFTQPDEAALQKFGAGDSFVISSNAQTVVNDYRPDIENIKGATVQKIPTPIGPLGPVKQGSRLENGVMISAKAQESENFVALMQFVDWLWYSDQGQMLARWGIDGETYTGSVEDGTFELTADVDWAGLNPGAEKNLQVDYGFFNGVFAYGGSTALLNTQFPEEEQAFQAVMNERETLPVPPPAPLEVAEREQASLWETGLQDHVNQQSLQFILGKRPLSEWDAYVQELEGKNMTPFIDLINMAHDRYETEHG